MVRTNYSHYLQSSSQASSRVAVSGGSKSVGILSTAVKMMRALTLLLALVLPSLQQSHKGVRQVVALGGIVHILATTNTPRLSHLSAHHVHLLRCNSHPRHSAPISLVHAANAPCLSGKLLCPPGNRDASKHPG